jgi:hypothetical protein
MAQTLAFKNVFNGGELSEDLWERSDLQQHAQGCAEALNLIGRVAGPAGSRLGFWDVGATTAQDRPARIFGFSRSSGEALFLEFGQNLMRVFRSDGTPVMSGGAPYTLSTPWTAAQAQRLWFRAINDVIYVTGVDGPPTRTLLHYADDNWAWSGFAFSDGPWLAENPLGPSLSLALAGGVGVVTASSSVFVLTDLQSAIRFREGDGNPGLDTWTAGTEYAEGVQVQFDGRVYQRVSGGAGSKSGTTPPLHQSGVLSDGKLNWAYRHDGSGILLITGFVSPTVVNVSVVRQGPDVTATAYWAKGAYSDTQGFPSALVEQRDERLIMASSKALPGYVDMTRSFGFGPNYGDFKPGLGTGRVVDDDAIRLNVGGTERVVWIESVGVLIAGCTAGEYVLAGTTLDDPVTPSTREAKPISAFGNADVAPLKIEGPPLALLHVLASRKVLRDTRFAPDKSVQSFDRSLMAQHIFQRGVAEMAWQQPDSLVWLRLDDGGLAVMTYHMEHGVYGVTRQPLPAGWSVESLATVRAPGGDRLMMAVRRTKAGVTQRRLWVMSQREEAMFLDGARRYAGSAPINDLALYEGEVLSIVADGGRISDRAVVAGAMALPPGRSVTTIGHKFNRRFVSLPLDMEGTGSTNARTITPTHATVILSGVDALVGTDAPDSAERVQARAPTELSGPVEKRMRARCGLGGGSGRDRRVVVESDAPFDLIIHAYRLEAEATK